MQQLPVVKRDLIVALVLFAALVVVFTLPLATAPGHLLPEHWDPGVFSWVMASNSHRVLTDPWNLFQGNVLYPHGSTVSYSEPLLVPTLSYAPVFWATGNPILAYNLTLLLFWTLSGVTMAWAARQITGSTAAGLIAGLVSILCAYRIEYYLEFQMHLTFAMPMALWGWYRFLARTGYGSLTLAVASVALTFYSSLYYALILCLALSALTVLYASMRPGGWTTAFFWRGAGGSAVGLLMVAPLLVPYLRTRAELGFERVLNEQPLFHSADLLTYLETRSNLLYRLTETRAETALFMGFVPTALAVAAALWLLWRNPSGGLTGRWGERAMRLCAIALVALMPVAILAQTYGDHDRGILRWTPSAVLLVALMAGLVWFVARGARMKAAGPGERDLVAAEWVAVSLYLALLFFVISLGPWVQLGGDPLGPGLYRALHAAFPPLRGIRVITRFGVIFTIAMSLLAALGARELMHRSRYPRRTAVVLGLLIAAEMYSGLLDYVPVEWPPQSGAYARIAEAGPAALLEVPFEPFDAEDPPRNQSMDSDEMIRSTAHRAYLVNGVSGFVPPFTKRLAALLREETPDGFPSERAQSALRSVYPLRFILVHRDQLLEPDFSKWNRLDDKMPGVRHVERYGEDDLFELLPVDEVATHIQRKVSFDFINRHPDARFTLALDTLGTNALPAETWATVRFNDRELDRLPLLAAPQQHQLSLPPPYQRSAANELSIDVGYRIQAPSDARYVLAATGTSVPLDVRMAPAGSDRGAVEVQVNGNRIELSLPGYHVLELDPATGSVQAQERFTTHASDGANRRLNRHLRRLAEGTVVAIVGLPGSAAQLDTSTLRALWGVGGESDPRQRPRQLHLLLGIKGAQRGTGLESQGLENAHLAHGDAPTRVRLRFANFGMTARPQR